MAKIMLDKEQMSELAKLGVDISKAQLEGFTLSELIDMIPNNPYEGDTSFEFQFIVNKDKVGWFEKGGGVLYITDGELIDRAYSLLIHGIKRGYINPNSVY